MKSIHIVDTNVILRYLLADHPEHYQVAKLFLNGVREGDGKIFFPESVIAECVYVMNRVYKIPREEIADKLGGILHYRGATGENTTVLINALQLYGTSNISIVDAIIVATARENKWKIKTFDNDLLKQVAT